MKIGSKISLVLFTVVLLSTSACSNKIRIVKSVQGFMIDSNFDVELKRKLLNNREIKEAGITFQDTSQWYTNSYSLHAFVKSKDVVFNQKDSVLFIKKGAKVYQIYVYADHSHNLFGLADGEEIKCFDRINKGQGRWSIANFIKCEAHLVKTHKKQKNDKVIGRTILDGKNISGPFKLMSNYTLYNENVILWE